MIVKKLIVLASISLAMTGQAHATGLLGKSITAQYFHPDLSTPYKQPVSTVVDGLTATNFESHFTILFTNDTAEISFLRSASWNSTSFNGFKIWDTVGVSIASSNMTGLSASNIRFDDNNIWVNWQGLSFNTGAKVKLNLFASAVPEPGTWALMLTGLALTGASLRRRARHAARILALA